MEKGRLEGGWGGGGPWGAIGNDEECDVEESGKSAGGAGEDEERRKEWERGRV